MYKKHVPSNILTIFVKKYSFKYTIKQLPIRTCMTASGRSCYTVLEHF